MTVEALNRILFGLVALAPAVAIACGPTRNKETTAIQIDAPADNVWAIVGNYDDMNWNAAVTKTEATSGSVPDVSKRTLTLKSGKALTDILTGLDPAGKTISFMTENEDTSAMPVRGYTSKITVRDSGGKTTVEWLGAFVRGYANNDPPPDLNDEAAIAAVSAYQKAALASLKLKIESGS
ncbi:MAG: SRPBCC family protein [Hyphomicrobium sp.]|nr:SRPBCC family protein [Hyphomicrobium sp.]